MDVESTTVIGKFAIVIALLILGEIYEWKDGYFFLALMVGVYFLTF